MFHSLVAGLTTFSLLFLDSPPNVLAFLEEYYGSATLYWMMYMTQAPSSRAAPRYPTTFRVWQRRTKTGCLTCRSRKKKCDETKPQCSACRRNGLGCSWLQDKQTAALQLQPRSETFAHPNHNNRLLGSKACSLTNVSLLLLQHYTFETAVILPAGKPSINPFISFVLPPAEADDVIMHSVLAVSGAHLSFRLQDATDVEMATRKHYLLAIRGVQEVIGAGQVIDKSDVLRLLLAISFLSQYEVSFINDGDFEQTITKC